MVVLRLAIYFYKGSNFTFKYHNTTSQIVQAPYNYVQFLSPKPYNVAAISHIHKQWSPNILLTTTLNIY